jgi:hypothetical protein
MTNEEIDQAIDGLKLQRFWPHQDDIAEDATNALAAIAELQARHAAMKWLADTAIDSSADHIDKLLAEVEDLKTRNRALEVMVERMTSKDDWEILIDMQRDQFKVRKAFKTVMQQLDDAVREVS